VCVDSGNMLTIRNEVGALWMHESSRSRYLMNEFVHTATVVNLQLIKEWWKMIVMNYRVFLISGVSG
jgi:hypothetical protein